MITIKNPLSVEKSMRNHDRIIFQFRDRVSLYDIDLGKLHFDFTIRL